MKKYSCEMSFRNSTVNYSPNIFDTLAVVTNFFLKFFLQKLPLAII